MKSWKKNKNRSGSISVEHTHSLSPRDQALKNGSLIDVSSLAAEAEITFPVAMTAAASRTTGCSENPMNSDVTMDRIWSVVYMLQLALKYNRGPSATPFPVYIRKGKEIKKFNLKAVISKDILYTQVITIMLPNEKIPY